MTKKFKDFYGGTATIRETYDGVKLTVSVMGKRIVNKTYSSERGARIAMGKVGDCWKEA